MVFLKKLNALREWATKLSAVMNGQGRRETVSQGERTQSSPVPDLTTDQIDAARHTPAGRAIAAELAALPPVQTADASNFNLGIISAPSTHTPGTPTPPAPPKKSWGSLRDTFQKHASSTVRNVILPAAAGYGVKQAAAYALALLPGGFIIGAAVGASASLLAGLAHDRIKGQKSSWKKHFARAATGAVSGMIGVDAADGFEQIQRFGSFLKNTFTPVAIPLPDAALVVARAASDVIHEAAERNKEELRAIYKLSEIKAFVAAKTAAQNAGEHMRLASEKAQQATRGIVKKIASQSPSVPKWQQVREAWKASDAQGGSGTKDWVKTSVSPITPLPDPSKLPASTLVESPPLPQPSAITAPHAAVGTPASQIPVAAMDTPAPVADTAALSSEAHVSLQTPTGEVSGAADRVVALQKDLAAAALAEAKQLPDGGVLTAQAGIVPDTTKILPGGEPLHTTRGYPTSVDQVASVGRGTAFAPAH